MARRAIDQHGYLDARSYLKTPRIFGFHGIYKRLAVHLGLVDVHLGRWPERREVGGRMGSRPGSCGAGGSEAAHFALARRGSKRLERKASTHEVRLDWREMGGTGTGLRAGNGSREGEAIHRRSLLLESKDRPLGALPAIWQLQEGYDDEPVPRGGTARSTGKASAEATGRCSTPSEDTNRSPAACRTPLTF